jgi:hypothetical protein
MLGALLLLEYCLEVGTSEKMNVFRFVHPTKRSHCFLCEPQEWSQWEAVLKSSVLGVREMNG